MAEFSKQYCENKGMGFDGDFDLIGEFDKLKPSYWIPIICEGYGFDVLFKDEEGRRLLGFRDYEEEDIKWKTLEEVIYE